MISDYEDIEASLTEKLKNNEQTLANTQALIVEYKEKNDTLSGLVTKYQAFADENEQLKTELSKLTADFTEQLQSANSAVNSLQIELAEIKKASAEAEKKAQETIDLTIERKDLEREKALVESERNYQLQLAKLNEQHNEKLRSLYAEIDELRKQNEDNRNKYQQEIAELKTKKEK